MPPSAEVIITTDRRRTHYFPEKLQEEVELKMIAIPGGSFKMGSLETEEGSDSSERPRHLVNVSNFFMSQSPITQAQWRFIAELPQIDRYLALNPSQFLGNDRPVEQVSWKDAMEFCARLSKYTDREYRLPSESEWEYACRAGTETPFYCGETITTELVNYNGSLTYGRGSIGVDRQETTPVGIFPANAFGLYDMHGNVWEWCLDHWHETYEGAPTDGSAWVKQEENIEDHVLKGGSYSVKPSRCRSGCRSHNQPNLRNVGFRVVCTASFMNKEAVTIPADLSGHITPGVTAQATAKIYR